MKKKRGNCNRFHFFFFLIFLIEDVEERNHMAPNQQFRCLKRRT